MTHRPFALTPRDAAITLFGAFVRALGNWIAIADMVGETLRNAHPEALEAGAIWIRSVVTKRGAP